MNNNTELPSTGIVSTREFGAHIEMLVRRYLEQQQLRFLTANYTRKCGEVDLIFEDESGCVVFVEVRYRKHKHYGGARESVDSQKTKKLKRTAHAFLQQHQLTNRIARIDVVAVTPKDPRTVSSPAVSSQMSHDALPLQSELSIEWIANAVQD